VPSEGRTLTIVECDDCGHAARHERRTLDENIRLQVDCFDHDALRSQVRPRWPNRWVLVAQALERLRGDRGRILDIGCGSGGWLSVLGEGWEKHGVEVSPRAAEIARKVASAQVFCGPFEHYQTEQTFDVVTAFALIEHLANPRTLVEWSYRHLRSGGYMILMTGDRESRAAREWGESWPLYEPDEHVHFFSHRSLSCLVTSVGFGVKRMEWRYGVAQDVGRYVWRMREILGLIRRPVCDHLYLWAQKPQELGRNANEPRDDSNQDGTTAGNSNVAQNRLPSLPQP